MTAGRRTTPTNCFLGFPPRDFGPTGQGVASKLQMDREAMFPENNTSCSKHNAKNDVSILFGTCKKTQLYNLLHTSFFVVFLMVS